MTNPVRCGLPDVPAFFPEADPVSHMVCDIARRNRLRS
jgi:hypothetical protein